MRYISKMIHEKWKIEPNDLRENLFLIGYAFLLGLTVWSTTMLPLNGLASKICKLSFIGLVGIKIICFDSYSVKNVFWLIVMAVCTGAAFASSRYFELLMWVFLIAGSRDVSFEKILKIYILIASFVMILAFSAAMFGLIVNLQYITEERGIRNALGSNHPTAFGAHIFFIVLSFFYLNRRNLRPYHFGMALLIGALIQIFCNARSDAGCIIMIPVLFGLGYKIEEGTWGGYRIRKIWIEGWKRFGKYIMPMIAGISVFFTATYKSGSAIWAKADGTLVARLQYGKMGLDDYGVKLFGQQIEMVGNGGTTKNPENYFYLDCAYINILLLWGIALFLGVMLLYFYICKKNQCNLYFQYTIALIALASVMEPNLMDFGYNPFPMAVWAVMLNQSSNCNKNILSRKRKLELNGNN